MTTATTFPGQVQTFARAFGSGRVAVDVNGSTRSFPFATEDIAPGSDSLRSGDPVQVTLDSTGAEAKVTLIELATTQSQASSESPSSTGEFDFSFPIVPGREVPAHFSKEQYIKTGARLTFK